VSALASALTPVSPTKVFGIGFHKTMTTSLARALYTLGYHVEGTFSTGDFEDEDELSKYVVETATEYDALQDVPWPLFYELLDQQFPGSKFILTVRDPDRWWSSVKTHFGSKDIPTHEYIYGVPTAEGHEMTYRRRFLAHNEEVEGYFEDRPDDLLVMDMADGDGWQELCTFLDVPVPPFGFPHQNPAGGRRAGRIRRKLRREAEKTARKLGVSDERLDRDRVRAIPFWAAVHELTSHVGALITALDELGDDRERMEGMIRGLLQSFLEWADLYHVDIDPAVQRSLDDWDLQAAWTVLCPSLRHWAGGLLDEGFGVFGERHADAGPPARALVNDGIDAYRRAIGALSVGPDSANQLAHI